MKYARPTLRVIMASGPPTLLNNPCGYGANGVRPEMYCSDGSMGSRSV